MAAGILIFPGAQPSRSRQGTVISAELRWYVNETTTPATVYTDPTLTVPHQFPIVSDDAGRFPLIYADDTEVFSCNWSTAAPDSQVQSYDFISPTTAADTVLLDEMNAVLSDAMDLYESLDDVNAAVALAAEYAAEAAEAATGAPGTNATSTTNLTIGKGSKSLTIEPGKVIVPGMTLTIASTASPLNAMSGQVTAYNSSTGALTVESVNYSGSGSYSAWTISLSALNQTDLLLREARTSNTMLGIADRGKYIDITSGTFTQTLDSAGTLGDGWYCYFGNSGTGVVTIDPAGTETIDGASTLAIAQGDQYLIMCDGSVFRTFTIKKAGWTLIETVTISTNQPTITFSGISALYADLRLEFESLNQSTNNVVSLSGSTDGSSFSGSISLGASATSHDGAALIADYRGSKPQVLSVDSGNLMGGTLTGSLVAVRLTSGGGGNFSSGTVRLKAR